MSRDGTWDLSIWGFFLSLLERPTLDPLFAPNATMIESVNVLIGEEDVNGQMEWLIASLTVLENFG